MKRVSLQDIFNAAWQAFIVEQRPPAVDSYPPYNCQYLTQKGLKCAVGLCIPDGHRFQLHNQFGALSELVRHDRDSSDPLFDEEVHIMGFSWLDRFQARLHDDLQQKGSWVFEAERMWEKYLAVAKDYGLIVPGEQE